MRTEVLKTCNLTVRDQSIPGIFTSGAAENLKGFIFHFDITAKYRKRFDLDDFGLVIFKRSGETFFKCTLEFIRMSMMINLRMEDSFEPYKKFGWFDFRKRSRSLLFQIQLYLSPELMEFETDYQLNLVNMDDQMIQKNYSKAVMRITKLEYDGIYESDYRDFYKFDLED